MHRRSRRFGWLVVLAFAALSTGASRDARAEADAFGTGNGQDGAKTVAGNEVVNSYARVTANVAGGATQIPVGTVVGAAAGFAVGDLVMIWRATGALTTDAQPPAITDRFSSRVNLATVSGGAVGNYELARLSAVGASMLTVTKPLIRAFAADVTQVIKVPEYTNVTVPTGTSLRAQPWAESGTGFVGGILVFLASGTVTLTGTGRLDADASGFRGGEKVQRLANIPLGCANEDGAPLDGYANKGEGVVRSEYGATKGGRGNWSLAAGGGNCAETGGGGGGHGGNGGVGGDSFLTSGRGGRGGVAIDYSLLERISMGGGGGAGEQKNGVGSSGGRGGGAIFVRASAIAGTGVLSANGETAANAGILGVESDGAGGGGAGGTIVVRTTGDATCGGLNARGGDGGDTSVVSLGFFGPGGGGGGGRVLIQGKTISAGCVANVAPGSNGQSGTTDRGAAAGQNGATQQPPPGPFCFSNPSVQCIDPAPVCNIPVGQCDKCNGGFGSNASLPCPVAGEPVCLATGACVPCNGDFGTNTTQACQVSTSPTCFQSGGNQGQCGKCTSNNDCTGPGHPGPNCNTTIGACGTACTNDSDCKGTEWCSQSVCVPKTPNGDPLPNVTPIDGECTAANGQRVCLSAVCEESDDLCGRKNSSPCAGDPQCRSNICFPADDLCGKPIGEPCNGPVECRSGLCESGVCSNPCSNDLDCALGQVCDSSTKTCVQGCRPEIVSVDGGQAHGGCPPGQLCVSPDGGPIGQCQPVADAGPPPVDAAPPSDAGSGALDAGPPFSPGLVEGGGCACRAAAPASVSPVAFAFAALGALAFVRRRSRKK